MKESNKKIIERIFFHYHNFPIPKNEKDFKILIGGVVGIALEIIPEYLREQTINIITNKYKYTQETKKQLKDMSSYVSHLLSDIWRCKYLLLQEKIENSSHLNQLYLKGKDRLLNFFNFKEANMN